MDAVGLPSKDRLDQSEGRVDLSVADLSKLANLDEILLELYPSCVAISKL